MTPAFDYKEPKGPMEGAWSGGFGGEMENGLSTHIIDKAGTLGMVIGCLMASDRRWY